MISLDRFNRSCNTLDDSSSKICTPNNTKDVSIEVLNMITEKNEAKTLVKHISYNFNCKF